MTAIALNTPETAIIDAALVSVHATKNLLGQGPPTPGAQYREAEVRLSQICGEMTDAFAMASSWGGRAGKTFTGAGEALVKSVERLSVIDHDVALCIHVQASEIWAARAELDAIVADLCSAKTSALALARTGNVAASATIQATAAERATSRCRAAVEQLKDVTVTHAGWLTQTSERLVRLEERLSVAAVLLLPQLDAAVVVSEAALRSAASALRTCSTTLAAEWSSMGPSILEEVRRTHGPGVTEAFNVSLGKFEEAYGHVLLAIWHQVEHCTGILTRAARLYEEHDIAAARILIRVRR